ncbi:SAV_2336 N-terminal domain-related protein [Actinomadura fulvescens]|uniref:FtsK domain-containing protein n=1 Tax=Actinomadura fulvescens TaxID=46160 RepID=A0ABN3PVS5_9ACTN
MTIDRLHQALDSLGPDTDARELSEILWLACHATPPQGPEGVPGPPLTPGTAHDGLPPHESDHEGAAAPHPPPPRPGQPAALHPRPSAPESGGDATEILVPTAPMLADPLAVQRALRPLKRRVASPLRTELDEGATAARIADTGLWVPVLTPAPERWLSLILVVDTGPAMRLWRPLARELTETIVRQGAFRDVHVTYLNESGRVSSSPTAPARSPTTLIDPAGRHAALVLSDCSGRHWWDGRAPRAVRAWAQTGPTAILQPLPERLWRRTAAPTTPGLASLPRPGAPNTELSFMPYDGEAPGGPPIPVLEIAPRWLSGWASLVAGAGPQPTAVAAPTATTSAPVHRERELPPEERVRRFLVTASPEAAELAAHVAVSVPSLPVMRLIQHRVLGESGPGQLAEVLLSGLLRPVGPSQYEFVRGAREALLAGLPRPEAWHTRRVLEHVSAEIERRAGSAAETFRALLPSPEGDQALPDRPFALLSPEARAFLDRSTRPTSPPPEPVEPVEPQEKPAGGRIGRLLARFLAGPTPEAAPPDLLELLGGSVSELIAKATQRPAGTVPVPIGVTDSGASLMLDGGDHLNPHVLITGAPGAGRVALLRTIVASLALTHPPQSVVFALADLGTGNAFEGLGDTPGGIVATTFGAAEAALLATALTDEIERRETGLRDELLPTLPALFVVVDEFGPALARSPSLAEVLERLVEQGARLGIKLVLASTEAPPSFAEWQTSRIVLQNEAGVGHLYLRGFPPTRFRVAKAPSELASILDRMWRGDEWRVEEWRRDEWVPVTLGTNEEGPVRLDVMDGLVPGHGLIVDEQASGRSEVTRRLVTELAAAHPPERINFLLADYSAGATFAGGFEELPHVADVVVGIEDDPGLADRLQEALLRELDRRQGFLDQATARAWHHYQTAAARDASFPPLPALFVLVNGVDRLTAARPDFDEVIGQLVARGPLLGVQLTMISTGGTLTPRHTPDWHVTASAERGRVYLRKGSIAFEMTRPGRDVLALARAMSAYGSEAHWLMPRRRPGQVTLDDALAPVRVSVQSSSVQAQLTALAERELERLHGNEPPRHLHLAFTGPQLAGKKPAARAYASALIQLGVLRKPGIVESTWQGLTLHDISEAYGGLLYVEDNGEGPVGDAEAGAMMERLRPEAVVVFGGESEAVARFLRDHPAIAASVDATVTFEPPSTTGMDSDLRLQDLDLGERLGMGGMSTLYSMIRLSDEMLYKEYRGQTTETDADAVGRLVSFPATLGPDLRELLLSQTAWPVARVMDGDRLAGVVVPRAPERFYGRFGPRGADSVRVRDLSYLLYQRRTTWGESETPPDAADRIEIVRRIAALFGLLHEHSLVVGDVSPTGVLWCASPMSVYLLDCDGMRFAGAPLGRAALETVDWDDPLGLDETASLDSDRYKLALLITRVLARSAHVRPGQAFEFVEGVPPRIAANVSNLFTRAAGPRGTRPTASEWVQALSEGTEG